MEQLPILDNVMFTRTLCSQLAQLYAPHHIIIDATTPRTSTKTHMPISTDAVRHFPCKTRPFFVAYALLLCGSCVVILYLEVHQGSSFHFWGYFHVFF